MLVLIGLLVVVGVVVVTGVGISLLAAARGRPTGAGAAPARADVARWAQAGLITGDQARAIHELEAADPEAPTAPRRIPRAVEGLAYVGGILLAAGTAMLISEYWDRLGTGGQLGIALAVAALTGVVGAVVGESDPVTWRLRGFLWAVSAVALASMAGIVAAEIDDLGDEPFALLVATATAVASGAYWALRDRPLQHLLTAVGVAVSLGVAVAWTVDGDAEGLIGLALWLLGTSWALAAWRGRLPPTSVGVPVGVTTTLVASAIVGADLAWLAPLLGLATASAWVAAGVAGDQPLAMAPGVAGLFVFLPWTLSYYVGDSLGAPAIAIGSGAVLLGTVLLLVRREQGLRRGDGRGDPPTTVGTV